MSLFVVRTRQVRPGTRIKDNSPKAPLSLASTLDGQYHRDRARVPQGRTARRSVPTSAGEGTDGGTPSLPNWQAIRPGPSLNRTGGFPASGSPVGEVTRLRRDWFVWLRLRRIERLARASRRTHWDSVDCRQSTSEQRSCGEKSGQRTEAADSFRPNLQPPRSSGNCGIDPFTCQRTHHELTGFLVKHSFTGWSKRSPRSAIRRG